MSQLRLTAWLRLPASLLAIAGVLALSACGGGSGAPNNPYVEGPAIAAPLVVVPDEAVAFAGTPLILSISGGTPPYQAFSGNPAALPVPQNVTGNTLALMANNVDATQPANVTIRDAAGQTALAEVSVRPAVLLPATLTIVPNAAPCAGGDVCSGQTSVASIRVTGPSGAAIPGRSVRFDVVQGTFALATTNPGSPLAPTQTVVSDANGDARVIISVPANTPTQIGLLRATDLTTGGQVTAQFVIAQVFDGAGVLSVAPSGTTTITGTQANQCLAGVRVSYYIFGGTPPYRVQTQFPDAVTLVGVPVSVNGGGFDVITKNVCFTGLTFVVTDATGRSLLTGLPTIDSVPGSSSGGGGTPTPSGLVVAPPSQTIDSCAGKTAADIVVTGGTPPYSATVSMTPPVSTPIVQQNPQGTFIVSFPATPPIPPGTRVTLSIGDASGFSPPTLVPATIICN